ncbi:unnamed protein product [Allacma fusca]|uniref:Uncharacterized protein n=1 Tax=Allacma fusca TaxID=39272 RepID=A0A8J2JTX7_9HEXA|nr:unnamed protein product [Allacma fusca]
MSTKERYSSNSDSTFMMKDGDFYHNPCNTDEHCQSEKTDLRCLSDSGRKICSCGARGTYAKEKQKCVINLDTACTVGRSECVFNAFCDKDYDTEGTCRCNSGFTEDLGECRAENFKPGLKCNNDGNCGFDRTHLKCLLDPKAEALICSCERGQSFDSESQQCQSKLGGPCELRTAENPYPQVCVKSAVCKLDKDAYKNPTEHGTCCTHEGICEEFEEIKPRKMKARGEECTSPQECNSEKTFMGCFYVVGANAQGKRICDCGDNNKFDEDTQQCSLGVNKGCSLPTYGSPEPQKCIKHAVCQPHLDTKGKETREGKCTCEQGAQDGICNEHSKNPSFEEMKSSGCRVQSYTWAVIVGLLFTLLVIHTPVKIT